MVSQTNLTCFQIGPATQMGLARNVTVKGRTHEGGKKVKERKKRLGNPEEAL